MTEADLLLSIRGIVRDELRHAFSERRRAALLTPTDRSALIAVTPIICALLGSETWIVRELFAIADEARGLTLRSALGPLNAKQFGKLLRRANGIPVGSYLVERVGDSCRDGALWRVLADVKVAVSR